MVKKQKPPKRVPWKVLFDKSKTLETSSIINTAINKKLHMSFVADGDDS